MNTEQQPTEFYNFLTGDLVDEQIDDQALLESIAVVANLRLTAIERQQRMTSYDEVQEQQQLTDRYIFLSIFADLAS